MTSSFDLNRTFLKASQCYKLLAPPVLVEHLRKKLQNTILGQFKRSQAEWATCMLSGWNFVLYHAYMYKKLFILSWSNSVTSTPTITSTIFLLCEQFTQGFSLIPLSSLFGAEGIRMPTRHNDLGDYHKKSAHGCVHPMGSTPFSTLCCCHVKYSW